MRPTVLEAIAAHARADAPRECCGLLIGRQGWIDEAVAVPNRAADGLRRYQIDPRDHLSVITRCRGTSAEVVGGYHSHPAGSPDPSDTDRAQAFEHFLFLIAGPVAGSLPVEIRAYRLSGGNFRPIRLVPEAGDLQE